MFLERTRNPTQPTRLCILIRSVRCNRECSQQKTATTSKVSKSVPTYSPSLCWNGGWDENKMPYNCCVVLLSSKPSSDFKKFAEKQHIVLVAKMSDGLSASCYLPRPPLSPRASLYLYLPPLGSLVFVHETPAVMHLSHRGLEYSVTCTGSQSRLVRTANCELRTAH